MVESQDSTRYCRFIGGEEMRKTSDPVDRSQRAIFCEGSELRAPASSLRAKPVFDRTLATSTSPKGRLFCKR